MKIIVYMTPTDPWSTKLIKYLKKRRIPFEEQDTADESSARDALIEKSGQLAVPLIDIDGKIMLGFDEEKVAAEIEKARAKK